MDAIDVMQRAEVIVKKSYLHEWTNSDGKKETYFLPEPSDEPVTTIGLKITEGDKQYGQWVFVGGHDIESIVINEAKECLATKLAMFRQELFEGVTPPPCQIKPTQC